MSQKVGFKDKFRNKFNIGKVARKPMREEVTALRARAMKLPQTNPEVKGVVVELDKAKTIIFGKVKTNQERETSVTITQGIVDGIKPDLERLEKAKPDPVAYEIKGKKASKEDLKRAKDMLGMLTPLQKSVEEMFKPSKDAPGVLMPPNLSRLDLLGQIETVRLHISQGIVDEDRGKELSKEIGPLQQNINAAKKFIDDSRNMLGFYTKQDQDAGVALQAVATELDKLRKDKSNGVVPLPADTPLALAAVALRRAVNPEGGLINPPGLKSLSDTLAREVAAAKKDPAAYAKSCCKGATKQSNISVQLKLFDDAIKLPLSELYEHAAAVGATDHAMLSMEASVARGLIADMSGGGGEGLGVAAAGPVLDKINKAIARLKQEADALRKRVTDAHADLTKTIEGIADTKGKKFFAADWIAVDALLNTIQGMIPAPNAALNKDTLDTLGAVEPLITKLKSTADALHPGKSGPAEQKFDLAKAAIEKVMKNGDPPSATLKKYDPKKWAELEEGYGKIEKSVGVSKFADAVKAIEEFKTGKFDPAVAAAKELAPVIATAIKAQSKYMELYKTAHILYAVDNDLNDVLPTPNTQQLALLALETELKKTPPDKTKLMTLTAAVDTAFKDLGDPDAVTNAALGSHQTEVDKEEKKKTETKANKETLQNRYYSLEMQFAEAKAMVKEAKGDQNAVKSLDRLMKQAESEIKAVTDDKKTMTKPGATMDRIQQRIDMMLAHPEGEAIRHVKELPGLYNEFRQIRNDAFGQLDGLVKLIGEYQTQQVGKDDDKTTKAVDSLAEKIKQYADRFTVNGDTFGGAVDALADPDRPEAERRKARETILAGVADLLGGITAHPISALLAESPIAGARVVPRRLMGVLDRLKFTAVTSVES